MSFSDITGLVFDADLFDEFVGQGWKIHSVIFSSGCHLPHGGALA